MGSPRPGALVRSGIGYVVVRNDLSPASIGYQPTSLVHLTLAWSGFVRVAEFGPRAAWAQTAPGAGPFGYILPSYPAVEIYAARPGGRPPPPATALPVRETVLLGGSVERAEDPASRGLPADRRRSARPHRADLGPGAQPHPAARWCYGAPGR
ncbi:MAG: alpha-(1-_3)-arabinofuranosyltransferase domain-containing protein [Streptosporangiaceae bacterium]